MNRLPYRILWVPPSEQAEQDCACAPDVPWIGISPAASGETDCACPAPVPKAMEVFPGARWVLPLSLYRAPLPDGHQLVFNPGGSAGVVVLNGPAVRLLDSFATPAPLTDPAARQLASLGLLQPLPRSPAPLLPRSPAPLLPRSPASHLTLWLHLTTRCNLRCAYCYALRGEMDMSPQVGRAAVDGALRSARAHGFPALKIKYAGGEPTLNLPTLQAVHEHARRRAAEAGLELQEVVLTNGTVLTPALIRWLRDEDIRLSVSIDGIGPSHDRQRGTEGGGSFALVARGVEQALSLGLRPHLSITITARNVDGLAEVVTFALERGLPFNLNFVRPVPGRPDLMPEPESFIAAMQPVIHNLQSAACNLPATICNLLDRCDFGLPHRYPCGAGISYLVVGPGGKVARCHMELSRTVGTVWDPDPLAKARASEDGFRNLPVEEKAECRDCPWRYVCAGGCPLTARRIRGREDQPSPYCTVYRAILPELLHLEGLRLLHQASDIPSG